MMAKLVGCYAGSNMNLELENEDKGVVMESLDVQIQIWEKNQKTDIYSIEIVPHPSLLIKPYSAVTRRDQIIVVILSDPS